MRIFFVVVLVTLAACGPDRTVGVNSPTPTFTAGATEGATATPSATPTRSATPSPSPSPTPLVSARNGIVVKQPLANARVRSPLTIQGEASVFEAALNWQLTDTAGRVITKGFTTATAGAPARGTFTITATYTDPASEIIGFAEVFTRSPKDGEIDEIVRVPIVLMPKS